jgi:hypothetical protein
MRTWRFSIVTALAAVLLLAPAGVAKDSINPSVDVPASLSAKYRLADGGYLVFAVDDKGRAEGYYFRDGRFGQMFGTLTDGVLRGWWAEAGNPTGCAEPKRGLNAWGQVELSFDAPGEFRGLVGTCDEAPDRLLSGRR